MAEQQPTEQVQGNAPAAADADAPDDVREFHVQVRERAGRVNVRKGTARVTVPRGARIRSQRAAEDHVRATSPGLEVLGAAPGPAEGEAAASLVPTAVAAAATAGAASDDLAARTAAASGADAAAAAQAAAPAGQSQ